MAFCSPRKPIKASANPSNLKGRAAAKDHSSGSSGGDLVKQVGRAIIEPIVKKVSGKKATPDRQKPFRPSNNAQRFGPRKSKGFHPVGSRDAENEFHEENEAIDNNDETGEVKDIESKQETENERCAICMDDCNEPKRLDKCGHVFCKDCIDQYFRSGKPQCPCCFTIYGEIRGNQPENGKMTHLIMPNRLPGFEHNSKGTIQITYTFPNGYQDERHPNPGKPYQGTTRIAFLPNNLEGQQVLKLLERAFKLRQTFTIGQSRTTGAENVITWNDIHHKTSMTGGMENFGYPDNTYLNRVQQELAAKGVQ